METHAAGVFFVDRDGTLVGRDGIAERVWGPLRELRRAGWRIAVCTGRPGRGVAMEVARRVDPDGLHVFESGGAVLDTAGRVVSQQPIPSEAVHTIARTSREEAAVLECYSAEGRYLVLEKEAYVLAHEKLLGFEAELSEWPPSVSLVRMQWVVPSTRWPLLREQSEAVLRLVSSHEGRSPLVPDVSFISMTALGVSKATGMAAVLAHYGVSPERAAMVGDNHNDIEGLRLVGRAFVPEDGVAEALALAHQRVPSANVGGVAEAVNDLLGR